MGLWAKRDYLLALKEMLKHQGLNDLASEIIIPKIKSTPQNFLTLQDIHKMVFTDWPHIRDITMAACHYEAGTRPQEFFMLKQREISFLQMPAKISNGNGTIGTEIEIAQWITDKKTDPRPVSLFWTVPFLKLWCLELKKWDTDSVWIQLFGNKKGGQISYAGVVKSLRNLATAAGIKKDFALYATRHGRITETMDYLSDAQQDQIFGWVQGSAMPRIYRHIDGLNMLQPILAPFGIVVERQEENKKLWLEIYGRGLKLLNEAMKLG